MSPAPATVDEIECRPDRGDRVGELEQDAVAEHLDDPAAHRPDGHLGQGPQPLGRRGRSVVAAFEGHRGVARQVDEGDRRRLLLAIRQPARLDEDAFERAENPGMQRCLDVPFVDEPDEPPPELGHSERWVLLRVRRVGRPGHGSDRRAPCVVGSGRAVSSQTSSQPSAMRRVPAPIWRATRI